MAYCPQPPNSTGAPSPIPRPTVMLRLPEVCRRVGLTASPIYDRIRVGTFPSPIPLGPNSRAVAWLESEIESWLQEQVANRHQPNSNATHCRQHAAAGGAAFAARRQHAAAQA